MRTNSTINNKLIIFGFVCSVIMLGSCSSSRRLEKKEHRQIYGSLGIDEGKNDNFALYKEASIWINTPYVEGGMSKNGMDCSGLANVIYKNVYRKCLERNTTSILKKNCRKISQSRLKEGDLLFFNTNKSKNGVNHVGIYLKNSLFIHASTSKGVMISNLEEKYFQKTWVCGGRVN